MLHSRISSVWPDRALVCHHLIEIHSKILEPVASRRDLSPNSSTRRFIPCVRSAIVIRDHLHAEDGAVFLQWNLDIETSFITMRRRDQVLFPVLDPLDRSFGLHCKQANKSDVWIADDLNTESSPDISSDESHPVRGKAQPKGKPRNTEHRHLIIAVDCQETSRSVEVRHNSVCFYWCRAESVKVKRCLHYFVGTIHRAFDIAIIPSPMKYKV